MLDYITDKNGDTANVRVTGASVGMQFQRELEDGVPKICQPSIVCIRQRDYVKFDMASFTKICCRITVLVKTGAT